MPRGHRAPFSSSVEISCATSPNDPEEFLEYCSVIATLAPALSTHTTGTSSPEGPGVKTPHSFLELNTVPLILVFFGSSSPYMNGCVYTIRYAMSSDGARKLLVLTDAANVPALPPRFLCSYVIVPPGTMLTNDGRLLSLGATAHSISTSAVWSGFSRTITSTSTLDGSFSFCFGNTCTLSNRSKANTFCNVLRPSFMLYSVPTSTGQCLRMKDAGMDPFFCVGLPSSSTYTTPTLAVLPSFTCATTFPVGIPVKCEM